MRGVVALLALALLAGIASAAQLPLGVSQQKAFAELDGIEQSWDLDTPPTLNSTSQYIFDTAHSLLLRWPNTRWRNGHIIIPATIPPGTLLYHGRSNSSIPAIPEWIATDPEHSYLFCREDCWLLTLVTTRELKLLYFDGSSAAKGAFGSMDTQDVFIKGEPRNQTGRPWGGEPETIRNLCDWGKTSGIDGFLRMEMDFEIMLCSFTQGVETVSMLNLVGADPRANRSEPLPQEPSEPPERPPYGDPERPKRPPGRPGRGPVSPYSSQSRSLFEVINAGSWHNDLPGESRIKVDYSGLVTFYDLDRYPSLVEARSGLETDRIRHRMGLAAKQEREGVKERIEDILKRKGKGSGVDWRTLLNVLVERFAGRFELMDYVLDPEQSHFDNETVRLDRAKAQLAVMLTPYFVVDAVPPDNSSNLTSSPWATPIFRQCATTHTTHFSVFAHLFTPEERTLLAAIRGTTHEICRVLVNMWVDVARTEKDTGYDGKESDIVQKWRGDLSGLMRWLDWSIWVRCKPICGVEEICYLPTWPFFDKVPQEDWWNTEPQPFCIRRVAPYGV
ncbi:hypothetical protein JAAARDRAFT_168385 [Jaapia argillacea MUCL 33604]|uniref:Uncharacterized protein n=1 Tax=Jaapia argillacea MUCL 33604 TaxID=933084 RepID=A0A067QK64_9AGAM|nr:hypothetical protein JAAARDRAFT_168385 [Jaapia argillacea MUCL 33604]